MRICRRFYVSFPIVLLWIGVVASSANAAEIYDYTGNDFTALYGNNGPLFPVPDDHLIASLTFSSPLNLTDAPVPLGTILSWSISDELGYFYADSTDSGVYFQAGGTTDPAGNIIFLEVSVSCNYYEGTSAPPM
jgi:hypothetical protein